MVLSSWKTPYEIAYNDNTIRDWQEENVTADISWYLKDNLTLRSITSWTDFDSAYDTDGDFSNTPGYIFYWDETTESTTQELQLHHTGDRFNLTGGLYWSEDEISFGFSQFRAGIFPFSDFADFQIIDVTTTAAFLQLEYAVSDKVRLIGGIRYNDEEKDTRSFFGSSTDTGPFTADPAHQQSPTRGHLPGSGRRYSGRSCGSSDRSLSIHSDCRRDSGSELRQHHLEARCRMGPQ